MACVCALLAACSDGSDHSEARHGRQPAMGRTGRVASDRVDLRSPDVDGRMDAVSRGTVFACPRARRLEVAFDSRGTVAVVAGRRPLAYGTIGTRVVNRACRSLGHLHGVPSGTLGERYEATKLTCALLGSVRVEVHPITVQGGGEVGSSVVVLSPDVHRILLAAVLVTSESRIYYTRACRAR